MKWGTFATPRELVGPPVDPPRLKKRERAPLQKFISMKILPGKDGEPMHDHDFKACGPGKKNKPLMKFPEWKGDPPIPRPPRVKPGAEKVEPLHDKDFKMTTKTFSRPTPSVVTNFRNIKSAFPGSFRK